MRIRWLPINETLTRTAGELRGLATLRAVLVVAIIIFQSAAVSRSFTQVYSTPLWIIPALAPPALFALLGFTFAQSRADDEPRRAWLTRRLRRAWPPLIAAVLLAVLAIGSVNTSRGIGDYFTDPATALYLLNLIGIPEFRLPGVFEFNDLSDLVNPILWAAPVFVVLALIVAFTPMRARRIGWAALVGLIFAAAVIAMIAQVEPPGGTSSLAYAGPMTGALLSGLLGSTMFALREHVPHDWRLAVLAALPIAGAAMLGNRFAASGLMLNVGLALPVAYLTIYLALRRGREPMGWSRVQPYLPALLLAAFPIQQAAAAFGPRNQNMFVNLALSLPALAAFALACTQLARMRRIAGAPRAQPWEVIAAAVPPARRRDRREPLAERVRRMAFVVLVGLILLALALGVMALTFFALQRDGGGV